MRRLLVTFHDDRDPESGEHGVMVTAPLAEVRTMLSEAVVRTGVQRATISDAETGEVLETVMGPE